MLAGVAFSLGLILVVIAGAELFTGNNLIVMAGASGQVSVADCSGTGRSSTSETSSARSRSVAHGLRSPSGGRWTTPPSGPPRLRRGGEGRLVRTVFWRGVLANALVCLAVWIATGGRSVMDKVIAIVPPIAAFVANAFEHSVANMYASRWVFLLKSPRPRPRRDPTSLTPAQRRCGTWRLDTRQHRRWRAAGRGRVLVRVPATGGYGRPGKHLLGHDPNQAQAIRGRLERLQLFIERLERGESDLGQEFHQLDERVDPDRGRSAWSSRRRG